MKYVIRFAALLFSIITLIPLGAHLLELPEKIDLSRQQYEVVQNIYKGWAWLGIFETAAIVLTFLWLFTERRTKRRFYFVGAALLLFAISFAVFLIFTLPANKVTLNWTHLPPEWEMLRKQWEYSHAIRAILNFLGVNLLIAACIDRSKTMHRRNKIVF